MSPDTDVAVIACYQYYNAINTCTELWFLIGRGTNRRFIPIHTIADSLGASICNLLPVFHPLTGCDSTASFSGKGVGVAERLRHRSREQRVPNSSPAWTSVLR